MFNQCFLNNLSLNTNNDGNSVGIATIRGADIKEIVFHSLYSIYIFKLNPIQNIKYNIQIPNNKNPNFSFNLINNISDSNIFNLFGGASG